MTTTNCNDKVQLTPKQADLAFIPAALNAGMAHHQSGELPQAQVLYEQILQADPDHADALHLLGLVLHQSGHSARAVDLIQRAIKARPSEAMFYFNLGNLYQDLGQLREAVACFRQTLACQPDSIDALVALGTALKASGQLNEAIRSYQQAIALRPVSHHVYSNLANALHERGRLDQAHYSLAHGLMLQEQFEQAIGHYQQALVHNPAFFDAQLDLASALKAQGRLEEAIAANRKALALQPNNARGYSNLLFAMQYAHTCTAADVFAEHQRYAARFEPPLKSCRRPHTNNRDPGRRLKVAYVSADFCNHVVAFFLEPILACHDKAQFEIYGYYNNNQHDAYTECMANLMDHFVVCSAMTDDQLAQRIRADGIDILVDLSGHTAGNRLPVFARKPAPVQVSYIGYPGSTGLTTMDYRISDPWQDPTGITERYHSETLVRLPSGMAFAPDPQAPAVNALPALSSGEFVFASLNNMSKVNQAVVNLWSRILLAIPQARLMLGNVTDSGIQQRMLGMFGQTGIGHERLILQPRVSVAEFLALHQHIDIALDPFPYNGGTTTMHALWMGVPVIALVGDQPVSRLCASHLSRVGLDDFVCHSEDAYFQCAVKFAHDLPALNAVRQSLRQCMSGADLSPSHITHQLEAAYRDMWAKWCRQ